MIDGGGAIGDINVTSNRLCSKPLIVKASKCVRIMHYVV